MAKLAIVVAIIACAAPAFASEVGIPVPALGQAGAVALAIVVGLGGAHTLRKRLEK